MNLSNGLGQVRLGRWIGACGGALLLAGMFWPSFGAARSERPLAYFAIADAAYDDLKIGLPLRKLSSVGPWGALWMPYLFGALVFAGAIARGSGIRGNEPVASRLLTAWLIVAGVAGAAIGYRCARVVGDFGGMAGGGMPASSSAVIRLATVFGGACPVLAAGYGVWAAKWARDGADRLRLALLLSSMICFNRFSLGPLWSSVSEFDPDSGAPNAWLSLAACALIAGGTLLEFPRTAAFAEVEREFGPTPT